MAQIHRAFDRGTIAARASGPGRAEVTVTDWPAMPDRALFGLRVAIERVLSLSGREHVRVVAHRTRDGARYDATFRA